MGATAEYDSRGFPGAWVMVLHANISTGTKLYIVASQFRASSYLGMVE